MCGTFANASKADTELLKKIDQGATQGEDNHGNGAIEEILGKMVAVTTAEVEEGWGLGLNNDIYIVAFFRKILFCRSIEFKTQRKHGREQKRAGFGCYKHNSHQTDLINIFWQLKVFLRTQQWAP